MLSNAPETASAVARIIGQAVAPVFLLAGIGAFLNTLTGRLARIVDRGRVIEPRLLESSGVEHDRLVREINTVDRRMRLASDNRDRSPPENLFHKRFHIWQVRFILECWTPVWSHHPIELIPSLDQCLWKGTASEHKSDECRARSITPSPKKISRK